MYEQEHAEEIAATLIEMGAVSPETFPGVKATPWPKECMEMMWDDLAMPGSYWTYLGGVADGR